MPRKPIGLQRRGDQWRMVVRVNGHLKVSPWGRQTPAELQAWRRAQRADAVPTVRRWRHDWWIYVIESDGHVKIGRTTDVQQRLRALQTASAHALTLRAAVREQPPLVERTIHQRFAHLRVGGEWFRLGADLAAFIDTLPCANT
jgi:hypothetical protein